MLNRRRNFRLAENVAGFLTDREGQILYCLAARCRNSEAIIEIGSWKGKSTIWLGQAVKDHGRKVTIYAIDPHIGSEEHQVDGRKIWTFEEFKQNIAGAGVAGVIRPLVKTSQQARSDIDQPVGLLFIDGAHDYDAVMLDFRLWEPLLVEGGYIAFHDVTWPGVRKAVEEIFSVGGFDRLYFADTLLVARKCNKPSVLEQWKTRNILKLCFRFYDLCAASRNRQDGIAYKQLRWMRGVIKFLRDAVYVI